MANLAGFMCWIATLDKLNGYVYYTNKLSENIKCLPSNKRIIYVKQKYNKELIKPYDYQLKANISNKQLIKPYDYQLKAKEEFNKQFINRGILSLPCGTGKTLISYLCSNNYKQIINWIISRICNGRIGRIFNSCIYFTFNTY